MRLTRLCPFALFAAFALASPVFGQVGARAFVSGKAMARGDFDKTFTDNDNDNDLADAIASAHATVTANAVAGIGFVRSFAESDVLVAMGDISIKAQASVVGSGTLSSAYGESELVMTAGHNDLVEFNTNRLDIGDQLIIRSKVTIKGGFTPLGTFVPGGPPPGPRFDTFGGATGQLSIGAEGNSAAFFAAPFDLQPIAPVIADVCKNTCGQGRDYNVPAPGVLYLTFIARNRLNSPLGYSITATMKATSQALTSAHLMADFSGSIHWGGILSVENAVTGEVIDDWTVTSQSGFDYSKPFSPEVPEPASIALLGFALCLWLRIARIRLPQPACL